MSDEKESIDVDSLSWGSAAKDCLRKVYGNLDKMPMVMAMKIEIANAQADFALCKISREGLEISMEDIKKHYEVK